MILHSQQDSGNCYKPRLLLAHPGLPFRLADVDANDGSRRRPGIRAWLDRVAAVSGHVPINWRPEG